MVMLRLYMCVCVCVCVCVEYSRMTEDSFRLSPTHSGWVEIALGVIRSW